MEKTEHDTVNDSSEEFCEFLRNMIDFRKSFAFMMCGSFFELPIQYATAYATDWDFMYIPTNICALPSNIPTPGKFRGTRFTIDTSHTYPGFTKLYAVDGKLLPKLQLNIASYTEARGPAYSRSIINGLKFPVDFVFGHDTSSRSKEIVTRIMELKVDRVPAIYCPYWPTVADEWKIRERLSGWPSQETINKIIKSGCYFVAKPHHSNPDDDTQWRFSFSQAELILIHSLTDVQKYIYHILRLIKSEVVKACGGPDETVLCTYFFKTLMLWECERKPKEFWNDAKVEKPIMELLCIMIQWLIKGCCSNYFIPKCNMLRALTPRYDFNKEIQVLLKYAVYGIKELTVMWPKAYPEYLWRAQVAIPQRLVFSILVGQLRKNIVNPLNPFRKTKLLKLLSRNNSFLSCKANVLYQSILIHLQVATECCPKRKGTLTLKAQIYFALSLEESGTECSLHVFSMGESMYELLERINSSMESESMAKCRDSWESAHSAGIGDCQQFAGKYDNTEDESVAVEATCIERASNLNTFIINTIRNLAGLAALSSINATRLISSAYQANFYYNALQDYKLTTDVCDKVFDLFERRRIHAEHSECAFYLSLTNKFSAIFDEHFKTVLGLITLHRFVNVALSSRNSVLVRLCPIQLIKYLRMQCKRLREGAHKNELSVNFKCDHAAVPMNDIYEPLSEVFMSAVVRASRS